MWTSRACLGLKAVLLGLAVMTAPVLARDDNKGPASGGNKGVTQKGPASTPKADSVKGRTETVDKDETISIHRKK
ncbi:MAG: hypothetical protein FJX20_22255 [Alphaproteobacteria bacterium]|nr:hypothetical protein [Alphaproteobacteria bacterium]